MGIQYSTVNNLNCGIQRFWYKWKPEIRIVWNCASDAQKVFSGHPVQSENYKSFSLDTVWGWREGPLQFQPIHYFLITPILNCVTTYIRKTNQLIHNCRAKRKKKTQTCSTRKQIFKSTCFVNDKIFTDQSQQTEMFQKLIIAWSCGGTVCVLGWHMERTI